VLVLARVEATTLSERRGAPDESGVCSARSRNARAIDCNGRTPNVVGVQPTVRPTGGLNDCIGGRNGRFRTELGDSGLLSLSACGKTSGVRERNHHTITMSDAIDLNSSVFSKTATGQQEIQTRSLGLAPLVRRVLVLGAFVSGGADIKAILQQLLSLGCVEAQAGSKSVAAPVAEPAPEGAADVSADIPGLVPAASRTAKENEMARNFMINSVNSIIGQNMRLSLVHDIFHAETTEQLRVVYRHWESSMSDHGMGSKRLPELREKLFKVL
jgi:hypothetical protein